MKAVGEGLFATVPVSEIVRLGLSIDPPEAAPYVLVVDDERLVADTLTQVLRNAGYAVDVAYDAETALAMADVAPPELLVAEALMPGISGIELATRLRTQIPDCGILLISVDAVGRELMGEAQNMGDGFTLMRKPMLPEEFLQELAKLTKGRDLNVEPTAGA